MSERGIFDRALNLYPPWYVERAELDPAREQIMVHLGFWRGGTFPCGHCGAGDCQVYDTTERQWRHLDCLGYRTILRAPAPRVYCAACGIREAELPWTRPQGMLKTPFEDFAVS